MAIPAVALLQQHDARRDIVTEPAVRRRAVIEARGIPNCGHSELGVRNWGRNRAVKTHRLVCLSVTIVTMYTALVQLQNITFPDVTSSDHLQTSKFLHFSISLLTPRFP